MPKYINADNGKLTISRLYSGDKNRNHAIIITVENEDNRRIIEVEMRPEEFAKAITGLACVKCNIIAINNNYII